ncbi:MAG: hypothetical protein ACR2QM_13660, partial [Longimicrobiales bacterium]
AQIIPAPRFSLVTSADLVSSGNIGLLATATRRALLRYLAAIETLEAGQTLWRFEKPAFAGRIPGGYFGHPCFAAEDTRSCLRDEAAVQLQTIDPADLEALFEWRTAPGIRLELQTGMAETHAFLRNLADVARARDELAGALGG